MRFGIREAVDVVFRAKSDVTIGNTSFVKDEPVIYFDSLKTSTLEGTTSTVYAQGGKGNPRLIAWEGDKVVTFTFEDALISKLGLSVLTGAGLIEAGAGEPVLFHKSAVVDGTVDTNVLTVDISDAVDGDLSTEKVFGFILDENNEIVERLGAATSQTTDDSITFAYTHADGEVGNVMVDFYDELESDASQVTIEPSKFAGYYYIEGDTLFRRQADGVDLAAQLIIPNAKVQSAFSFVMAGSGDPSTFTFTADAFPGVVKGGSTKVLSAINILED